MVVIARFSYDSFVMTSGMTFTSREASSGKSKNSGPFSSTKTLPRTEVGSSERHERKRTGIVGPTTVQFLPVKRETNLTQSKRLQGDHNFIAYSVGKFNCGAIISFTSCFFFSRFLFTVSFVVLYVPFETFTGSTAIFQI